MKLAETEKQLAARIEAAKPEQDRLAKERETKIKAAQAKLADVVKNLESKVPKFVKDHAASVDWHPLLASKASSTNKANFELQSDRSVLASGKKGKTTYTIEFPTTLKKITGLRLEALADPSLPGGGPGLPPNGNFVITEFEVQFASKKMPKKARGRWDRKRKSRFHSGRF